MLGVLWWGVHLLGNMKRKVTEKNGLKRELIYGEMFIYWKMWRGNVTKKMVLKESWCMMRCSFTGKCEGEMLQKKKVLKEGLPFVRGSTVTENSGWEMCQRLSQPWFHLRTLSTVHEKNYSFKYSSVFLLLFFFCQADSFFFFFFSFLHICSFFFFFFFLTHREANGSSSLRAVYTAMHGVGYPYVQESFKAFNLPMPIPVDEQVRLMSVPSFCMAIITFSHLNHGTGTLSTRSLLR